jgi:hypothetical protein
MALKIVLTLKEIIATAHTQTVSSKKLNAAKHNSVYTLKKFYFKINRAFALKE